jgi:hypothetical protein
LEKSQRFSFSLPLCFLWILVYFNGIFFLSGLGGNDGWGHYANLESLLEDQDVDLKNNIHARDAKGHALGVSTKGKWAERHGGAVTYYLWGHSLFYAPPFLLGGFLADRFDIDIDTSSLPEDSPYHGQDSRLMLRVFLMSLYTNFLTLLLVTVLFFSVKRMGAGNGMAFFTVLLAWWGSPLPYYANNSLTHVVSCLWLACCFYLLLSEKISPIKLGMFAGFFALTRSVNALVILPLIVFMFFKGGLKATLKMTVVFTLLFGINLFNWYVITGNPFDPGYGFNSLFSIGPEVDPRKHSIFLWNVMFDLHGGYFVWFPAALPAVFFLFKNVKKFWPWWLLSAIFFIVIALRFEFHGGGGYGPRYLSVLTVLLLPGFYGILQIKRLWPFLFLALFYSSCLYVIYASGQVAVDPVWEEPGRHLSNYLLFFENPPATWGRVIVSSSNIMPRILKSSGTSLLVFLFPLVLVMFSFFSSWTRQKKTG